jgi:flavin reductase (DIM6/NTAB) family NADH-FMN oxidoreductase RutF
VAVDLDAYRGVMGRFATGVTVIATGWGDALHAMTANAVTSLSLDPLRLLICVQKESHCAEALQCNRTFSVNVLREDQEALSVYFAGQWRNPTPPRFEFVAWQGGPRLKGVIAAVGCEVAEIYPGGDHLIFTGTVVAVYRGPGERPLLYQGGEYRRLP